MTVSEVAETLSGEVLAGLADSRWDGKVLTGLPKFQTEFDTEMNEVLKTMGMVNAFDENLAETYM